MSKIVAGGAADKARESFEGVVVCEVCISLFHFPFFVYPSAGLTCALFAPVAYEMSRLLNTGLDREQLSILISLCENGVNPEVRPPHPCDEPPWPPPVT